MSIQQLRTAINERLVELKLGLGRAFTRLIMAAPWLVPIFGAIALFISRFVANFEGKAMATVWASSTAVGFILLSAVAGVWSWQVLLFVAMFNAYLDLLFFMAFAAIEATQESVQIWSFLKKAHAMSGGA